MREIITQLYTNKKSDWIAQLGEEQLPVQGNSFNFLLQRWLVRNDFVRVQVRWLDKYTFSLPPKMFLSLAWSVLPKTIKVPRITDFYKLNPEDDFLKKEEKLDFILKKVKKHYKLSDNDYRTLKKYLIKEISDNMINWFRFYGVKKQYWNKFHLDFRKMKDTELIKQQPVGLGAWGM